VYKIIISRITNVETAKGIFISLRMNICNTLITRYSLAVAPSTREIIKNKAPVLCDIVPNR
jgi:hypothetical protein